MQVGQKYLLTTDNWFWAPDGQNYIAVHGTVHAVVDSAAALGVRMNAKSTNWYVVIGDMIVAGCQIHYAVRCDAVSYEAGSAELDHDGYRLTVMNSMTRIYNADASRLVAFSGADAAVDKQESSDSP